MKTVRDRHPIAPSAASRTAMTVLCEDRAQSLKLGGYFRFDRWLEVDPSHDRLVSPSSSTLGEGEGCARPPASLDECLSERLSAIMTSKVFCVAPQTPLEVLAMLFMERDLSAAPVVDVEGRAIGLVSKTDLVRALFGKERPGGAAWLVHDSESTAERLLRLAASGALEEGTAEGLMTPVSLTVDESMTLAEAIRTMSENRLCHLIVHGSKRMVVGIISALDVVDLIANTASAARS
jgi:CBS domain-containing protein